MFIRINAHGHLCIVCTVDHVIVNTDFLSTYNTSIEIGSVFDNFRRGWHIAYFCLRKCIQWSYEAYALEALTPRNVFLGRYQNQNSIKYKVNNSFFLFQLV